MIKRIVLLVIMATGITGSQAQTIRTKVLVVGGTAGAVAASIQAARSGVETLLISEDKILNPVLDTADIGYLEKIQNHFTYKSTRDPSVKDSTISDNTALKQSPENTKSVTDTAKKPAVKDVKKPAAKYLPIPKDITREQSSRLIKSITDTVKNLSVMLNTGIREIKKSGKGWNLRLQNGNKVKVDLIVDATGNASVAKMLKIDAGKTIVSLNQSSITNTYNNKLFRTSAGEGEYENAGKATNYIIPLGTLLPVGVENFIVVPIAIGPFKPVAMSAGQAAGASAAYCAFFNTTTKNINVRVIQGELMAFESYIIPFADIAFTDRHAIAFQHVGATGLLKAKNMADGTDTKIHFDTAGTLSSEELKLPMKEYYSRSQIWFADKNLQQLTIKDAIDLIMYTATRGDELRSEIEKGWKTGLKFNTTYDPKRAITRREFAVLLDRFMQPFNRRVDIGGNLLN